MKRPTLFPKSLHSTKCICLGMSVAAAFYRWYNLCECSAKIACNSARTEHPLLVYESSCYIIRVMP